MSLLSVCAVASPARAWDPFEIEVYEDEIDEPGRGVLELHDNYVPRGRTSGAAPELASDRVLHETLEASVGLGHRLELGGYLQAAVRPEGRVDFAGAKVRLKWHAELDDDAPVQLGANVELSAVPDTYEAGVFAAELRPIISWRPFRGLHVDVNPIVSVALAGPDAGKPELDPAIALRYAVARGVEVSLEYYGSTGPVTDIVPIRRQLHYLFACVEVTAVPAWSFRAGVGEGLTHGGDALLLTLVVAREL